MGKTASSINGVENWAATHKRIKVDYLLTLCTKLNSKQMKGMSVSPETIKLLEKNTGSKLSNINLTNFLLICLLRQGNKNTSKYMGTHQAKKLLHNKGNLSKNQFRSPTELEKILQTMYLIGESISKYTKNPHITNTKNLTKNGCRSSWIFIQTNTLIRKRYAPLYSLQHYSQ